MKATHKGRLTALGGRAPSQLEKPLMCSRPEQESPIERVVEFPHWRINYFLPYKKENRIVELVARPGHIGAPDRPLRPVIVRPRIGIDLLHLWLVGLLYHSSGACDGYVRGWQDILLTVWPVRWGGRWGLGLAGAVVSLTLVMPLGLLDLNQLTRVEADPPPGTQGVVGAGGDAVAVGPGAVVGSGSGGHPLAATLAHDNVSRLEAVENHVWSLL